MNLNAELYPLDLHTQLDDYSCGAPELEFDSRLFWEEGEGVGP